MGENSSLQETVSKIFSVFFFLIFTIFENKIIILSPFSTGCESIFERNSKWLLKVRPSWIVSHDFSHEAA